MQIGVFGLGKMGSQIARRLHDNSFEVLAWNRSEEPRLEVGKSGVKTFAQVGDLVSAMDGQPRVFWIMLLQEVVEEFLQKQLLPLLKPGDIVIDGGNIFYEQTMKRAAELNAQGVVYYDCGVSGGVWGYDNGFGLMVGGPKEQWAMVEPIFKALSSGSNYGLLGK